MHDDFWIWVQYLDREERWAKHNKKLAEDKRKGVKFWHHFTKERKNK